METKETFHEKSRPQMSVCSKPLFTLIRIHTRESIERKVPTFKSLPKSVEVKSQFLQNLSRLKGQFTKITEDLTKQERILVKEWQDKVNNKNEKEHNKR